MTEGPESGPWRVRAFTALSNFMQFRADEPQTRNRDAKDQVTNVKSMKVAVKILRNISTGYPEANGDRLAKVL